ncbi:MAG: hypothetical protein ACR65W_07460 [Methylocystis sp.]
MARKTVKSKAPAAKKISSVGKKPVLKAPAGKAKMKPRGLC